MEVITRRPASPPSLPRGEFRFDDSAYATAPCSPHRRLPSLTAPPSPDPFDLLPPSTPRLTGANPFDLFQHFTSAPASPRRAAAIYAHFADANRDSGAQEHEKHDEDEEEEEFQHRSSYSTAASAVPFDWEETPGTPKAGIGMGGAAPAWDDDDDDTGDFEFGTVVDKAAPAESTLTTADELFEKGRIRPLKPLLKTPSDMSDKGSGSGKMRPLKPPPGLLDGGGTSVGSSPRSPMAVLRSPRRRSRVGSGTDFDPFAAALLEASKAAPVPSLSPLGTTKEANGMVKPKTMTASKSAGWRRWRLSDLLLFRSSSEGGRINSNRDSIFKCSPGKANGKVGSVDDKPKMKQGGAAVAEGVDGCARLSPLQRLARGLGGHSWHHGRGMAAMGTKG